MKKKTLSRLIGLALTASMAAGLSGCGSDARNSSAGQSNETVKESSQTVEKSTASGTENTTEEITYPLDTDDKLSIWSSNQMVPNTAYADYTESPFHIKLAENTGVEVEWMFPALGEDATQAYNLLLTEDELPNIIFNYVSSAEADQLIDDGVVYDLTEYLPVYAPDYWETINRPEYASVLQSVTTEKGRYYGVEQFVEEDYCITYVGPVVRKDWLDACGLDEPVTMEDWEEVLVAFKEKYNATFGFFTARLNNIGIGSGTGSYGTFKANLYVDDNDQIQLAQAQPEWKEYMAYLHKWYEMGLIDPDFITTDDAAMRTKVLNNEIGISFTAMSQLTAWVNDAEAQGTGAEWIGIEYPRTAEGEPTCMIQTRESYSQGWCAMVTTSCSEEELITALKWLNYGYTEEGYMYWNFGTEGETYYLDDNGVAQWTDLVLNDPDGVSQAVTKYTGTYGTGITMQAAQLVRLRNSEASVNAVYKWIDNTEGPSHCVPLIAMTDDEAMKYSDKMNAIATYVSEMGLKYVTGEENLAEFDKYVEELNGMGLQECLEIQQAAYERYKAK